MSQPDGETFHNSYSNIVISIPTIVLALLGIGIDVLYCFLTTRFNISKSFVFIVDF